MYRVPLDQRLHHIGFRILYEASPVPLGSAELFQCDIEKTLIEATFAAVNDGRLRSILFSWFSVHADHLLVEKFFKLAMTSQKELGSSALFNSIAVFCTVNGHHSYKKYISRTIENEYPLGKDETESFASIQGYKEDWLKFGVKVPKKAIRIRCEDALTLEELSHQNLQFRNRLLFGPCWRADIITAIEYGAKTPAEIARLIGCSYEPAYRVFKDYSLYKKSNPTAA